MKALISDKVLVQASKREIQLLKAGAKVLTEFAQQMAKAKNPKSDIWQEAYAEYSKLYSDIEVVYNSMPF